MGQWRCKIQGREQGPFSDEQLKAMAADGRLAPTDDIWNPAAERWESAAKLRGLFAPPARATEILDPDGAPPALKHVADDVGPMHKILDGYLVDRAHQWTGPVVVSPTAIYLLKVSPAGSASAAHVLGAAGAVLTAALAAALEKPDNLRSCRLAQLPARTRTQLEAAARQWHDVDLIVLPKIAVSWIYTSSFGCTVRVRCGENVFELNPGLFGRGRVRRCFEECGWTLDAETIPAIAPVHGAAVGLAPGEAPATLPLLQRIAYAAAAIVMLALVLYIKMHAGPNHSYGFGL